MDWIERKELTNQIQGLCNSIEESGGSMLGCWKITSDHKYAIYTVDDLEIRVYKTDPDAAPPDVSSHVFTIERAFFINNGGMTDTWTIAKFYDVEVEVKYPISGDFLSEFGEQVIDQLSLVLSSITSGRSEPMEK